MQAVLILRDRVNLLVIVQASTGERYWSNGVINLSLPKKLFRFRFCLHWLLLCYGRLSQNVLDMVFAVISIFNALTYSPSFLVQFQSEVIFSSCPFRSVFSPRLSEIFGKHGTASRNDFTTLLDVGKFCL